MLTKNHADAATQAPVQAREPTSVDHPSAMEDWSAVAMTFRRAVDDGIRKRANLESAPPPKTIHDLKTL